MRKKLFILSLLVFINSCSYFRENYRETSYTVESGERIRLIMYEMNEFFGAERNLYIHTGNQSLTGKDCEDAEFKTFSNEVWAVVAKENDLSKIKTGTIRLFKQYKNDNQTIPEFCDFIYSRRENGEWIEY